MHQALVASEEILPRDLVHYRRNQCVSRLSCTKPWSLLGKFSRGTWCIANAINAFPDFLAPSLGRFWGNSPGGLGASPTQSMRFQAFLHQVPADSEAFSSMDLVHRQRNQCVSRLSCTKSWSLPRKFSRGTWCITDAINAFPDFLAPSLGHFRGNSPGGLGALSTQSMRFQAFLHQVPAASGAFSSMDLVHRQRNQCLSRLSCTKSPPLPRHFPRWTWCIPDAINAFPGFLAPSLDRFRGEK